MKIHSGYIVLADISGFHPYLAEVELEHADDVLADLLGLVIKEFSILLKVAQTRGDAVLAHQSDEILKRGETLLELVEATYVAFQKRLEEIRRDTTCDCRACRDIKQLDLKFFLHHGRYTSEDGDSGATVIGLPLGGLDAHLIQERILKDQVDPQLKAYAIFTQACLDQLGFEPDAVYRNSGEYPSFGRIDTACVDLKAQIKQRLSTHHAYIGAQEADQTIEIALNAEPPVIWDWLNDADKRAAWQTGTNWTMGRGKTGRTLPGTENHCAHNSSAIRERVTGWQPFSFFTVKQSVSGEKRTMAKTFELKDNEDGTTLLTLHMTFSDGEAQLPAALLDANKKGMEKALEKLQALTNANPVFLD
jgi:hypothetical protein